MEALTANFHAETAWSITATCLFSTGHWIGGGVALIGWFGYFISRVTQ